MAAGLATLCYLRDNRDSVYPTLEGLSADLVAGVTQAAHTAGISMTANRVGSMFTWFFTPERVNNWETAETCDTKLFGSYFRAMLDAGIYLPPSQFEAAFLGTAHTATDIQATIAAAREAFALIKA
jgi:glutamate-1-semialdehyde 2,1-aminomutase